MICSLLLSLASCGGSGGKDTSNDYSEQYKNLVGKWTSNCFLTPEQQFKDPTEPKVVDIDLYVRETLEYTDTTFKATRLFYSDPSCTNSVNYVLDPDSGQTGVYDFKNSFESSDGLTSNSYKMEYSFDYSITGAIKLNSKGQPVPRLFEKSYYFDVEKMYPVLRSQENLYVNFQIEYTLQ
ncbi:hypothetical protein [Saccharobesus litoralis]|nr:hypothetical protein [Saccharobesus litoralis]